MYFLSITYNKKTKQNNKKKNSNHNIDTLYRSGGSQRGAGNELRYELTLILNSYTNLHMYVYVLYVSTVKASLE